MSRPGYCVAKIGAKPDDKEGREKEEGLKRSDMVAGEKEDDDEDEGVLGPTRKVPRSSSTGLVHGMEGCYMGGGPRMTGG